MEALDDRIKAFVGDGDGDGYGDGDGDGNGYGDGDGDGYGYGNGNGYGYGYGYGNGYGYGDGNGYGNGDGYGDGNGNGDGYGDGNGNGYGNGIKSYNGHKVYIIDGVPTCITSLHGNTAKGFIFIKNQPKECYIVKDGDKFAHGDTLKEAFADLQEKLYDGSTEEERLSAFMAKFPEYDTPYGNADLFAYHHVLTGSCKAGRKAFIENKGIDLGGTTTVRQFITLTINDYGGDTVAKLGSRYNK